MTFSFNAWQILGLILASGLLWMLYVRSKDRHQPEPSRRLLFAFVLGIGAFWLSALGYFAIESLGVPDIQFNERRWNAVYCFGIVGPLEEGAKVLVAYPVVFRWREYDEPIDGFVYASAISLGFACMENFQTIADAGWLIQLACTVTLPITHVLFSSIWGLGIGHAHFCVASPARRVFWQAGSIGLSMFAHGLHDYFIFAFQATLATSVLALVIWAFVIWRLRLLGKRAASPPKATDVPSPK